MSDDLLRNDTNPTETQEWLDALATVLEREGADRARYLLSTLGQRAGSEGGAVSFTAKASNTIAVKDQPAYPGDLALEEALTNIHRWNAVAMLLLAKKKAGDVGGHISSYASIANLYEVGFNHFYRADSDEQLGDMVYFQGHSSEGNYARSYLEGRLSKEQMLNFRQEALTDGLSSYPHPWLMKDYWQFATVSLGLGGLQAVYQARFLRYLESRGLADTQGRHVWGYFGDGEMDEPESIAGLTLAARERLDNLTYIINCNLQRLDGLVRSNFSVVQEYERLFKGAGWNVIKVLWGSSWDALFAKDHDGVLVDALTACVDGQLQEYTSKDGAYIRENFFAKDPNLLAFVDGMSDEAIHQLFLDRGGLDREKIYAAYDAAVKHEGQPTLILMQTVKGFGFAGAAESRNIAHNVTDLSDAEILAFRDRFNLPLSDEDALALKLLDPSACEAEVKYMHDRRKALGGYLPARRTHSDETLEAPSLESFGKLLQGSDDREMSTTMVMGRILSHLLKDKVIGKRIVPIFPDETRTFGMEALFRQSGIYSSVGQKYTPEDKSQLMYYRETTDGQVLQEGITEAGAMSSWISAATSYSVHNLQMMPFYTYYSMFGFQRVGDFIWAAGDMRARGFLIGATAGRTTLAGEGLQHQDGHSLLMASYVPNCVAYDPAFGYEMTVIVQNGLERMLTKQEDVFYYVTAMNGKYIHPDMPEGVAEGIVKGLYLFSESDQKAKHKVQLLGSGAIFEEVIAAAELLEKDFGVHADVWGATSMSELRRDGLVAQRHNLLNPGKKAMQSYVEQCLDGRKGPVIAATDYVKAYSDLIRPFVSNRYVTLGTDGFGRSDARGPLREYFEVSRHYVVVAALSALVAEGELPAKKVEEAVKKYGINTDKINPVEG